MQELFSFKQKNPHVDLEPFLAQSSQYFRLVSIFYFRQTKNQDQTKTNQTPSFGNNFCTAPYSCGRDYIERGLRKIEEEGCAMPISSIGGIGGELDKARYDGAFLLEN